MSETIIGVDLGGTRIRAARLDKQLQMLERVETFTKAYRGRDATLERIKDQIREVLPEDIATVRGIGVSAPGPLNPDTGVVVAPPNLDGWHDVPLRDILHEAFDVPVFIGNDANVAALAETVRGVAKGLRHTVYITVSTGIGSGIIVDGRLLLGREGLAAEIGHIPIIVENGRVSDLEDEASGTAIGRQARKRLLDGEASKILKIAGDDITTVDGKMVGQAAAEGDPLALELITRAGTLVGLGIVTILQLFNPEIVIVGGGVTNTGDLLFTPMREAVQQYSLTDDYWLNLDIVSPALGEDVSIIGAGALVATNGGRSDVVKICEELDLL